MRTEKGLLIHAVYADDFLHFSDNQEMLTSFRANFKKRFDIKTGAVDVYLGNRIVVEKDKFNVCIDQSRYIDDILVKFQMENCSPVSTPIVDRLSDGERGKPLSKEEQEEYRAMVGSLLYLSCWTRPDISFAVSELSRFVSEPGETHRLAAKHLIRYIKGTKDLGLRFSRPCDAKLDTLWGYVDSDWAGCPDSQIGRAHV